MCPNAFSHRGQDRANGSTQRLTFSLCNSSQVDFYSSPLAKHMGYLRAPRWLLNLASCMDNAHKVIIMIITRFSCLEARYICRQAAVKAAKVLPLVGLARSKQAVGTVLNIYTYTSSASRGQCDSQCGVTNS
jgi:hypothetical protein